MTGNMAVIVMAFGTAALALWTHVRFSKLAPEGFAPVLLHVALAVGLLHLVPVALHLATGSVTLVFLTLFGVVIPALVYIFLASIWTILMFQGMLYGARR